VGRNGNAGRDAGTSAAAAPPAIRFCLFGHPRVTADGRPFNLATPRKSLPVLAYLLLHRGAPVARSFLAYLIWPDETEEAARAKLRATLFDLVRVLPPAPEGHWIAVDALNVQWSENAAVGVDVEEFDAAIADSDRLEEAVELYAGDFLEPLYDEWIAAPRERYRGAYVNALEQVISRCRQRLDFPRAIACARRLLETDPLREDVARRLIALRFESGDRAGAIEEYERFHALVHEELDIDPMPETIALREAILRNEAVADQHGVTAETERKASPARTILPFVGRDTEMEQLLDAWSRAARGRGSTVLLGGDPGIGKSRLVAEFARVVDERGGRVVFGATGSPETMPYQAFIEALRTALPFVASIKLEKVWLAVLASLLPELSTQFADVSAPARIEPENEQPRLFEALTRGFVALARARPLLIVLEDLHWAKDATVASLSFLAHRIALAPILVVATFRDNETIGRHPLRRFRNEATIEGVAKHLQLRPLSIEEVELLTSRLTTTAQGSAAELYQASEGSPLLLGQLLEDRVDLRPDRPSTIASVIAQRLDRLSPDARRAAEIAALIGPRFSREVVRDVGGWDGAAFGMVLDELIDRRVVREATGRGALDYTFVHQLVCDVAADTAPASRAADRHRRIARSLEAQHPELAEEFAGSLARHYEIAGEFDAAARHYLVASRRALALAAVAEARAFIDRGLALAAGPAVRMDLLVTLADASERAGDRAAIGRAAQELTALAEVADDSNWRRSAAMLRVKFAASTQDEAAYAAAMTLLKSLTADADPRWRTRYYIEEARVAYGHADLEALKTAATAALDFGRQAGDDANIARALAWLADYESNRGNIPAAQTLLEQAQAAAVKANEAGVELESFRARFMVAYSSGDSDVCVAIAERWLERGIAVGDRYAEATGHLRAAIALVLGRRDFSRTRAELAQAMAIFQELRWLRGVAGVYLNQAIMENEIANFDEAARLTKAALEIFIPLGDTRGKTTALSNLASIHAEGGDGKTAYREANEAMEAARSGGLLLSEAVAQENLAAAAAALGQFDEAIRLGDQALAMHRKLDFKTWSGRMLRDLALWHAQTGDLAAARERLDLMLAHRSRVWGEWPQRFHWVAAQILRATGDEAGARRELESAHALVASLEMELTPEERGRYRSAQWNREVIAAYERGEWPSLPDRKAV
jgi:DNA-binding SARP family transcriptional activator